MLFYGSDIGIDLGTASVLVYKKGQGIVLQEPSVVAVDKFTNEILAVGEEARRMLGKTPQHIEAVRPLKEGVISDFDTTERMIRYFIEKSVGKHWFRKPKIAVCVPSKVTEVERRAVEEITRFAGAGQVYIIEEPIAAAIGAGIDINRPCGSMVVDIGGGTTDIAVISLGGNVVSTSIRTAGDHFNEAIIRYMKRKHNLLIGERTAEMLKINIGTVYGDTAVVTMDASGRNMLNGLPAKIKVTSDEMNEAMRECAAAVIDAVRYVLDKTPPELSADISERGIVMTGGGAMLYGMDKLIKEKTGINAVLADEPICCVAIGTGKYVEYAVNAEKSKRHESQLTL